MVHGVLLPLRNLVLVLLRLLLPISNIKSVSRVCGFPVVLRLTVPR